MLETLIGQLKPGRRFGHFRPVLGAFGFGILLQLLKAVEQRTLVQVGDGFDRNFPFGAQLRSQNRLAPITREGQFSLRKRGVLTSFEGFPDLDYPTALSMGVSKSRT